MQMGVGLSFPAVERWHVAAKGMRTILVDE